MVDGDVIEIEGVIEAIILQNLDLSLSVMSRYLIVAALLLGAALVMGVTCNHWCRHESALARRVQELAWLMALIGASTVLLGLLIEMLRCWR